MLFKIPSEDSYWALDEKINHFMRNLRQKNCLAIIHYGEHGDEDWQRDEDGRRPLRGVWAVTADPNSPKLNWSDMQPKLGNSEGHVLLLLDCCFAAQAARSAERVIPANVELVAACAMRAKAPLPGEESFTSKWLNEVENKLAKDGHILVSELHDTLPARNKSLQQTPQHWGLQGRQSTIRLDPLLDTTSSVQPLPQHTSSLVFRIMTRSPLDNDLLDDILDWLKVQAPRRVSSVKITEMSHLACGLREFVLEDINTTNSVATIGSMAQDSQQEIRSCWDRFKMNMVSAASSLTASISMGWGSEQVTDDVIVDTVLRDLEKNIQTLQRVVQRGVLSLPQLQTRESLISAIDDPNLNTLHITDLLRTRLLACFPPSSSSSMQKERSLGHPNFKQAVAVPLLEDDHAHFGRILVEYKYYEDIEEVSIEICKGKVNRLAAVLQTAEPREFHTPTCIGWFHDKNESRFALMFQIPQEDLHGPISLRQILEAHNPKRVSKPQKIRRSSLANRFSMARKVGGALARWHSAGWLHQGVASHNVMFLRGTDGLIQYNEPYLCGLEFSRKYNELSQDKHLYKADLDAYMHPDRQGRPPRLRHTKNHDCYSFGLLLVEIAIWDYIPKIFESEIELKGTAEVQKKAIKNIKGQLCHCMGDAYEQATMTCLQAKFTDEGEDTGRMLNVVRRFEDTVLKALEADPTVD
jgi:tRNA A-37 threonylcarbamoyl transferase component Bud32